MEIGILKSNGSALKNIAKRMLQQMKKKVLPIFISLVTLSACQVTSDMDTFDVNTIDLTRITGEKFEENSQFESLMWPAVISVALLAALSANGGNYNKSGSDSIDMDTEWIE